MNLDEILNKVKDVEEEKQKAEQMEYGDPRILNLKKGVKYIGRLIPNHNNIDDTFVTYEEIAWNSKVDNTYVFGGRSPTNAKIKDDIVRKTQFSLYNEAKTKGDEVARKDACNLIPKRKQLVNFYLYKVEGDDAKAKEKVGHVVVLRYPAMLDKDKKPKSDLFLTIHTAIFGDKAKKIGKRAFDLSANGRSLVVAVTDKGGFNNYSTSEFDDAEDLGLAKADIEKIYTSSHILTELVPPVKSNEELKELLDTHWFGTAASAEDEVDDVEDEEDNLEGVGVGVKSNIDAELDDLVSDD